MPCLKWSSYGWYLIVGVDAFFERLLVGIGAGTQCSVAPSRRAAECGDLFFERLLLENGTIALGIGISAT